MTEFSSVFGGRISSFLDYRTARGFKRATPHRQCCQRGKVSAWR